MCECVMVVTMINVCVIMSESALDLICYDVCEKSRM